MIKLTINEKSFPSVLIFKNASIELSKGSFIAIKGPSGSGKTTLMRMIGLLDNFDGEYYYENLLIKTSDSESYRKKLITYVFQTHHLIDFETVKWNVSLPLKNLKIAVDNNNLEEYAHFLGIMHLLNKRVTYLSGGEKQRVSILRALLSDRPVILADEPTGNLDSDNVQSVMNLFKAINKQYKKTIIMVTHDNHLDGFFDKIYKITDHKIS